MFFNLIFSLLIATLACFFFRKFSKSTGLVDVPDGVRKTHEGLIPLGGGMAIALAFSISLFFFGEVNNFLFVLVSATLLLMVVGIIDDYNSLPISIRLIAQIISSWLVILFSGIYVSDLGNLLGIGNIYLGQLGIPVTIFMVVGVCNAFNMLDGMDGLVTIVSFISVLFIAFNLYLSGNDFSWAISLLGALGVFFLFNFGVLGKKHRMFLGDSGALSLGFFVAWMLIYLTQEPNMLMPPVSAIWIILIPLIDALSAFYRRIRAGKKIFIGDRKHLHFILLERGNSKLSVLLLFSLISFFCCSVALICSILKVEEYFLFYGFLTLWAFYLLLVKYPETKE